MNRRRSLRSYVVEILFTYGARRRHLLLPGNGGPAWAGQWLADQWPTT